MTALSKMSPKFVFTVYQWVAHFSTDKSSKHMEVKSSGKQSQPQGHTKNRVPFTWTASYRSPVLIHRQPNSRTT